MKQRFLLRSICSFAVLALCGLDAFAQFQLRIISAVDSTAYPALSATVQCTLNGTPTTLDDAGVLIASSRFSIPPRRVQTLDASRGTVRITWNADPRLSTEAYTRIIAWKGTRGAIDSVRLPRLPIVRITNGRSQPVDEIVFGTVQPGTVATASFYVQLYTGRWNASGTGELPITIDSIVTSSPIFHVEWVGWSGSPSRLPTRVYSPLLYLFRVSCQPPDTTFQRGTLTIYFDGELSMTIPIQCNQFYLPATEPLRFTWPRGGELLSPCSDVTIRWTGMAANARVAVDYSLDDGSSWTPIAVTSDTSTTWTVPNAPTSQLRLRLRQVDAQNLTYTLSDQNSGAVARLTFRPDGKRLLVQHALNGELVEWDVAQRQITWRALPPDVGQIQPVMLAYIDTAHAVALYNARGRGYASLVRIGESAPLWSDTLLDQTIRSGVLDTANRTIAVIGTIAPTVELFRIESAAIAPLRSVPMPVLATALAVRRGDAFVALRDARIHHYRIPDWSTVAEYRFAYVPHIALLHALPDGKRLAIGCSVSQTSVVQGFSAPNFVLDLERNQIVRSNRQASSSPVAVTSSADARYLVFGYPGQPQSPLWDLATDMILSQATSHQGTLADVQFSPDQRYVASSSATPPLELVLRTFLFPATAVSPALTIGSLQLNADTLTFAPVYAYTQTDTIFRGRICNNGSVPIPLVDYWVEGGPTFQLVERIATDMLKPGQCTDVLLRFAPTRAGRSTGALVVRHCEQQLRIPLAGTALPRSVSTPDTIDVGTACVGTPARTAHVVLTNNDPAPLPIGGAAIYDAMRSPFRLVAPPRDTIIGGKHALLLTIEFAPTSGGIAEGTLYVYYGWRDYTATVVLRGRGIGGTLQPHVSPLPFIPEQRVRELRLRNTQSDTLRITSAQIEPAGGFRLRTSMPLAIAPGDSASIAIEWLDPDSVSATLVLRIDPCASELRVRLVRYSARAELQLPTVWADVRGRAAIPILARMIPNFDYGDPMRCTLRVATHRRLFMPDTAWTVRGIARLLSVTTDGDRRIATIEVERTLGTSGDTLVTLGGVAALGEQDTSVIAAVAAPYWGSAVEVTTTPGLLQLTGLCDDRRTYESGTVRMIVFPTPTSDPHVDIAIESTVQFHGELELYTMRGELVAAWPLDVTVGTTTASIPIAHLDAGTYAIVLRGHSQRLVTRIVVVR